MDVREMHVHQSARRGARRPGGPVWAARSQQVGHGLDCCPVDVGDLTVGAGEVAEPPGLTGAALAAAPSISVTTGDGGQAGGVASATRCATRCVVTPLPGGSLSSCTVGRPHSSARPRSRRASRRSRCHVLRRYPGGRRGPPRRGLQPRPARQGRSRLAARPEPAVTARRRHRRLDDVGRLDEGER